MIGRHIEGDSDRVAIISRHLRHARVHCVDMQAVHIKGGGVNR